MLGKINKPADNQQPKGLLIELSLPYTQSLRFAAATESTKA
jgi:hypothetical protein